MTYRREQGPPLPAGVSYEWWLEDHEDWSGASEGRLKVRHHGGVIFEASTTPESWSPDDVVELLERRAA